MPSPRGELMDPPWYDYNPQKPPSFLAGCVGIVCTILVLLLMVYFLPKRHEA
jgi:hypothetical protein